MANELQLWFKSTLFGVEPGEDSDTNPGRYGKSLANWLREKLVARGWIVEDIVAEDWGWCLLVECQGFHLRVGCGNVEDYHQASPVSLSGSRQDLIWTCFVEAEASPFTRIFRRRELKAAATKLFEALKLIVTSEAAIAIIAEP